MPAAVPAAMDELLAKLDAVLRERAPGVAASLQPGLTDPELTALEQQGGITLTEEFRALYRWHNGIAPSGPRGTLTEFIPAHRFLPLDEAIAQRAALRQQVQSQSPGQRLLYGMVAGHRDSWLTILDDGAGDGYFYDPERRDRPGHFFYSFAEDASYEYFPSLRNFLAGVIQCYETGVYRPAANGTGLDADFVKVAAVYAPLKASNGS